MPLVRIILKIAGFACLAGVLGLAGGIGYACSGDNPGNLCGLVGFFITGPMGFVAGGAFGVWWVVRRKGQSSGQLIQTSMEPPAEPNTR